MLYTAILQVFPLFQDSTVSTQIFGGGKIEILLQDFQTLHLFDVIHSNENKKYSYIFHIELVSKVQV